MTPNLSQVPDRAEGRSPLAELLIVAAPSVATMVSYPLKQFVDARMVAELGPEALAGQGNGSILVFLIVAFFYGTLTIVNTYVSQHLGAGRPERGPTYAWNGLYVCVLAWLVMAALAFFVEPIFALAGHGPEVLRHETTYARILLFGSFFTIASRGLHQFFYGVHRPMVVFVGTVIGNVVNIVLDYALIFGHWGFPEMGVAGAAVATVIGTAVEWMVPFALFLGPTYQRLFRTRDGWRPSWLRLREIVELGWPTGLQYGAEIACWGLFMAVLVGRFGAEESAASWIALRYMQLSFMPALGLSFAVTAVVGRRLGRREPHAAAQRAWLGLKVGMVYMGLFGLALVVFRGPLVRFFIGAEYTAEQAAEVMRVGGQVMIIAAIFQVFDAVGIILAGALRGAGDTVWPGLVTAGLSWSVIIGGGSLMIWLAPGLGSIGPWVAAAAYIILLGLAMGGRWISGRWRSIDLVTEKAPRAAEPA